ncbi:hypothetical protein [uncultured Tateyamaria sp.]|uniref:hypothetical protein n=1 Tax=uncultured Tateyamaria sp. TaxID=455651 RepID=UPI002621DA78|nr:hypothetical protein [uncultured Tateyamaria sp.]
MTLTFRLFVLFTLVAGTAYSAEIPVRSGAHDTFARLVLDVPKEKKWSLEKTATGITVTITGHTDGFDISRVFDRIDQTYVSAVDGDATSLDIKYGCECQAEVFRSGSMLVVDVSALTTGSTDKNQNIGLSSLQFVGSTQLRFTLDQPGNELPVSNPPSSLDAPVAEEAPNFLLSEAPSTMEVSSLKKVQEQLANRIGFAATTGILRPSDLSVTVPQRQQRPQIDTSIFNSSIQAFEEEQTGPPSGNLRITSSSDVPNTEVRDTSTTLGMQCIDPVEVRVQDWGGTTSFATSISLLRGALFSEFDKIDKNVAVELARLYLHFGFGAEAKQVLLMDADLAPANRALVDIADVMEFGSAQAENYLGNFTDCDSDVALWAILSAQNLRPSSSVDSSAALLALSSLPIHLRNFLAPVLSRKLLKYGDEVAAAAALRGLERTVEPLPSAAELAKADIELTRGDVEAAQGRLEAIVASNDQQSAEALIRYVNTQLDAEIEIDEDIATLVEAYAIEMRNDPLGEQLQSTHVLALAKSNQFDSAFDVFQLMRPSGSISDAETLYSTLLFLLAQNANDATFLKHAFPAIAERGSVMSTKTTDALAQRLANLGFFAEANKFLSTQTGTPVTRQRKVLLAQISLGLSQPRAALAHLGGVAGDSADSLRAQANINAGYHDAAYKLFSGLGDEDGRTRAAWLSENWQQFLGSDDPVLGPMAEATSSRLDISNTSTGMLNRMQGALEESATARRAIEQLLEAHPTHGRLQN